MGLKRTSGNFSLQQSSRFLMEVLSMINLHDRRSLQHIQGFSPTILCCIHTGNQPQEELDKFEYNEESRKT